MKSLDSFFDLKGNGTSVRVESMAGLTTFLTMAYITVVNPAILADAGMDFGAVFVATCIAAAFGSIAMGLLANYPVAFGARYGAKRVFHVQHRYRHERDVANRPSVPYSSPACCLSS